MDRALTPRLTTAEYQFVVDYDRSDPQPRPLVPVRVRHRDKVLDGVALLDSGAEVCCFPSEFAAMLGMQLAQLPETETIGASGSVRSWRGLVTLQIGSKQFENCPVYFVDNPDTPYIVGRFPIFRELQIGFRESRQELYLSFRP